LVFAGPEIRTGNMSKSGPEEVELRAGQSIIVTVDEAFKNECSAERIFVDYKNLPQVMQPGSLIYIDDGLISIKVVSVGADGLSIVGEVLNSGNISSHKGVNLPGAVVDLPSVSEQDKRDLQFGVEQGVDIIFASFIRKPEDVQAIRDVLGPKGARIFIISKIENQVGAGGRVERAAGGGWCCVANERASRPDVRGSPLVLFFLLFIFLPCLFCRRVSRTSTAFST